MKFIALQYEHMEQILEWRNGQMQMLRTPYLLSKELQSKFYFDVVSNRHSRCRFWGVIPQKGFNIIAMAGLEDILWENRTAEISLITDFNNFNKLPEIFQELKKRAFEELNLVSIYNEVYRCSQHKEIWEDICKNHNGIPALLPVRKYWNGKYYSSVLYTFLREDVQEDEYIISKPSSNFN